MKKKNKINIYWLACSLQRVQSALKPFLLVYLNHQDYKETPYHQLGPEGPSWSVSDNVRTYVSTSLIEFF